MNIGLIGKGFVGQSLYETFKDYYQMQIYDLDKSKCTVSSIKELMQICQTIFVAVPTPINIDTGEFSLKNIHSVFSKLNKYGKDHLIILKSSVAPQTTEMLNKTYSNIKIVFNPEFLREKTAIQDFRNQKFIILGGEDIQVKKAKEIYQLPFPNIPIYTTNSTTAEMSKFFINIFLATKVSLANEFYQICQKLNINYDDVRKLGTLDKRIGNSHTQVPGEGTPTSPAGLGISGSCFPLNLEILIDLANKLNIEPVIMKAVRDRNSRIDRPEKDWLIEGKTFVKTK